MGETAGTRNGPGADGGTDMDPITAADIMRQAHEHARTELTINTPLLLGSAGLFYLLGYGTVWLGTRNQHPYQGPAGWALGVLLGLVPITVFAAAAIMNRAASGIGGQSARRRRSVRLWGAAGLVAVWGTEGGLGAAGTSIGTVDLIGASGPILVAGVVLLGTSAWQMRPGLGLGLWNLRSGTGVGLGLWLIAVAAVSALVAPATVWGIDALGCYAGFLVAAGFESRSRRS